MTPKLAAAVVMTDTCDELFFCLLNFMPLFPLLYPPLRRLLLIPHRQAKINAEAVVGRVVGAITGKKEGENIVDITTTIDLLQVFWEAEKVRNISSVAPT